MRITLAELELHRVSASESYVPGALDFHGAEFRQTAPLDIKVNAELLGTEIRIQGDLATRLEANCARCLGPVEIPVTQSFDLFYQPMQAIAKEEEVEIAEDEMEMGFYSGDGIELADIATEQVILSVPMKVICGAECRGLCPACGANWNVISCKCAPPQQESPFASLKKE